MVGGGMNGLLSGAVPGALAAAALAAAAALPPMTPEGPPLALVSGVVVATVLAAAWPALAGVLGVLVVALLAGLVAGPVAGPVAGLVVGDVEPLAWGVGILAPLVAVGTAHLRRAAHGVAGPTSDALEILGVAGGTALIAAALAGAFALPGGPGGWALAQGLGVLVAAPPLARFLEIFAPRPAVAVAPVPVAAPPTGPTGPTGPAGLRVLVVEDDAVNRLVAMEILRAAGHAVASAASGVEGVTCVTEDEPPYDIVLLDLHMPGLDGADALRRIRALPDPARAGVPAILLSADVTAAARKRGLAAGADAFLTKPFEAADLFATLDRLRGQRHAPQEVARAPSGSAGEPEDLDLLESRLGDLGADSLGRILGLFQDAAPRHLDRLRACVAAGDVPSLRREAHTLKGAAAVIGAKRLSDGATAIERAADDLVAARAAVAHMEAVVADSLAAVEVFARRHNVPIAKPRSRPQETSGANT